MAEQSKLEKDVESLKKTIKELNAPPIDLRAMLESMISPFPLMARQFLYVTTYRPLDLLGKERGLKTAHVVVYGCPETKLVGGVEVPFELEDVDTNSTTFYPNRMPEGSKLYEELKEKKDQFLQSLDVLAAQSGALIKNLTTLTTEMGMSAADVANKLATMPPQPAAAAYSIFAFNAKIATLATSLAPLMTALAPLTFVSILFPVAVIASVESTIDSVVVSIDTTLKSVSALKVP
jgi:hypothetical protein